MLNNYIKVIRRHGDQRNDDKQRTEIRCIVAFNDRDDSDTERAIAKAKSFVEYPQGTNKHMVDIVSAWRVPPTVEREASAIVRRAQPPHPLTAYVSRYSTGGCAAHSSFPCPIQSDPCREWMPAL